MKKFENYSANLAVLARANEQDLDNDFILSGIIDKFFLQFELGWKTLKDLLAYEGLDVARTGSPREIIKSAYRCYDSLDEDTWLAMLSQRNNMAHVYDAAAARALVFPETAEEVSELVEGSQILRIIFNGASAAREPLIAKMAVECGIMAGIIGASTRSIGDRAYGYMLLEIPGTPEDLARAVTYLSGIPDIVTQVEAEYGKEEKE